MPVNMSDAEWGLTELHTKMLEILEYVNEFCSNNNIEYSLAYGSALGAKRHSGFIPWDDDADIYMTLDGYRKFKQLFNSLGDKNRFYLQEMDSIDGMLTFAKLRMNGTTYVESLYKDYDIHHGIYIDIFILFNAPQSKFKRKLMNYANQYLEIKGLSNRRYTANKKYLPLLSLLRCFPYNFGRKKALKFIYTLSEKNETDEFYDSDLRTFGKSFYRKDWLFPAVDSNFAGTELRVPKQAEKYLTQLYGDYMQLPSIESIQHSQHAYKLSTTEDFHKFTSATYEYVDEHRR